MGLEPESWARPAALAPANKAAPSIRVVAIRIVRLTFGRNQRASPWRSAGPSKPLPKYGISRSDQAPAPVEPKAKARISGTYGWVRAKTSLGNRLKGWIGVSPVLRLKRRIHEVEGGTPWIRSSVYLRR